MQKVKKRYRVRLEFKGPVHFGYKEKTYNITDVFAHSDTIFSGILNCYSLLYGKTSADALAEKFFKSPPFKISSAFLYAGGEFFVPKPLDMDLTHITGDYKKAKKIRYVPLEFILGEHPKGQPQGEYKLESGILTKQTMKKPYFILERPRVVIDRKSSSTEIYYVSGCYFAKNAGLWFFLDICDNAEEEKVKAAIRLLGDEGLGGERAYGFGSFNAYFDEVPLNSVESNKTLGDWLLLSLYFPAEGEDVGESVKAFSFVERGGYSYSPFGVQMRKKRVRMLAEGSVFRKRVEGAILDVSLGSDTEHKVLKYGLAYMLPFVR